MNLLIYTENHVYGGGNKYMIQFINALNINYNVTLITNKNGVSKNELDQLKYKITHFELDILSLIYMFKNLFILKILYKLYFNFFNNGKVQLIKYISKKNIIEFDKILINKNYDFVFAFNGGLPGATSCLDLLDLTTKYKIKSVLSILSIPTDNKILINYYLNTIKNIDFFIVNCLAIKNILQYNLNIISYKIFIITQFVDLPIFNKKILHNNNALKLGFVGRVEKGKGIFILLKAFKELNKKHKNLSLEIYGKNYLKFWQKLYISSMYNYKNINFKGTFTSINEVYDTIDILILPSLWEGLPYVILESMSFGIPVIASDVGGISEVVIPNFNGHLIKRNSYKSLYEVLDNFEISSYSFYCNNSRCFIEKNFTKKTFESSINSFFDKLNQDFEINI